MSFTPRQLVLLVLLTLVWGFNWTAMKVAISEVAPFTFRTFCLAAGSGVLFAVLKATGQPLAIPRSQWRRLALIAFFTIRPLLMKRMWHTPEIRTNVEALVGQRGKVTQDFDPGLRLGRVAAAGDDWRAESVNDRALRVGDLIEVVRVESNTLIVKPVEMA